MTSPPRVHLIIGTRPEAVKLAPLASALRASGLIDPVLVATGQHPTMVGQALEEFGLRPDVVLRPERHTGEQVELAAELGRALDEVVVRDGSAAVVVQGDTTSALIGGLVAFWRKVRLIHLEAGLRSGDLAAPFPEEANRRLLTVLADLHLAPTPRAVTALTHEHVPRDRVLLIGNTVVDAATEVAARFGRFGDRRMDEFDALVSSSSARLLLVTAHRRESWGRPLARILDAVTQILDEHPDVRCVLPAHPNPAVRAQVDAALAGHEQAVVTDPVPYGVMCGLLSRATLVLSDSGGVQEEAPSFGVPVLVLREVTERMEAVEAGWARLVGTDPGLIVSAAKEVLDDRYEIPASGNPFGDGRAADRGACAVAWLLGLAERPVEFSAGTFVTDGIPPV